jgi:two-component system sensor histidine kinase KdpD
MEVRRPRDFLEILERAKRGRLKVYLGSSAGVGKTWRMLEDAHALAARGVDVVIGFVETHGRKDTEALLPGLEIVPRRRLEYRGIVVEEMDLDAVRARKPQVTIVDELPHTNVLGSRHRRRYEDVQELLDAGIHVICACNVQHVESLNDLVRRTTGVQVRETVPDAFLRQADQVVNVDIAVDDLIERLKAGKVYTADKVGTALEAFFRPENLEMLRELALREVAESLDRRQVARGDPQVVGKVMVCLASAGSKARQLLRKGSRIAGRLNTHWYVVHVARPGAAREEDAAVQRQLLDNLAFAQELGAEAVRVEGTDVAEELVRFAAAHGVAHIIVGRSERSRWQELLHGNLIDQLIRRAEGIDIQVVTFAPEAG